MGGLYTPDRIQSAMMFRHSRRVTTTKVINMQVIPEIKELTDKLKKLGTFTGGVSYQYISVVKNIRSKHMKVQLNLIIDIPLIKYEKLLKFLDEL